MRYCIVTGCDRSYRPYALGLLRSVAAIGCDKYIAEFGLTDGELGEFAGLGAAPLRFTYPHDFPAAEQVRRAMPGFGGMLVRPYLAALLPSYQVIVWIDADAWVQDAAAIAELVAEAAQGALALVPEVDRGYVKFTQRPDIWHEEHTRLGACFGQALAESIRLRPVHNSGVFAIPTEHVVWRLWQDYLQQGLARLPAIDAANRIVEQGALNLAIWRHRLGVRRFPCTYNWMAAMGLPLWDMARDTFVENNPPYEEIRILHLSSLILDRPQQVLLRHADLLRQPGMQVITNAVLTHEGKLSLAAWSRGAKP